MTSEYIKKALTAHGVPFGYEDYNGKTTNFFVYCYGFSDTEHDTIKATKADGVWRIILASGENMPLNVETLRAWLGY